MTTHCLKTWRSMYDLVKRGQKTFEYRRNDRNFQVGDILKLEEYDRDGAYYTGAWADVRVTLVVEDAPGLPAGFCIMQIERIFH